MFAVVALVLVGEVAFLVVGEATDKQKRGDEIVLSMPLINLQKLNKNQNHILISPPIADAAGALLYQIGLMACLIEIPPATETEATWLEWNHSLHHHHHQSTSRQRI